MQDVLFTTYRPSEDEEYMSPVHLNYFKEKLLAWRRELVEKSLLFLEELKEYGNRTTDILDQGAKQTEIFADFSTREREARLLQEIDLALDRIEDGEYGYCEITGEEIGLKRLEAQPAAKRCIEAQEQFERLANSRARSVAV